MPGYSCYKKFLSCAITTAFFYFAFSSNIYTQHYSEIQLSNGQYARAERIKSGVSAITIENGIVTSVQNENPEEAVRVIVTFKEQPLSEYQHKKSSLQKSSISSIYSALQTSHIFFRAALNVIQQQLSAQLKSDQNYKISRDYYRVLNGAALKCNRVMIDKIRTLPMVKYVDMDSEVKVNLKESVHQIRADIVQDSLKYTGKGVLVGEIDTGIDYNNPVLGSGFGPAFRVIGGYDFVNNDSDPMDDNGHGTHVAGIIGAKGEDTLCGVAPGVNFIAVKAFAADGSGFASDVIAGLEYCLDPDGNPATDDGVEVINMSFGEQATIYNSLDSAVNNTTKAGVLCIIAAGNSGYGIYGTIESPGTSETALTVGACDSSNSIAYFSSLGPASIHSYIKPEVVAPGVNILSTILHNQTASWSGTSMATPHVTGVAALLKQEHPFWTPEDLKAAIVNTAHSVGESVSIFAQGNGCVDALDAAKAKLLVEPGIINFGRVDLASNVWKDTVNLKVKNFRSISKNIQVSIEGLPAGAMLTFDKMSFSLAPWEETTIMTILSVPTSVPIISTEPYAYIGKIKMVSDSDNVIVPFGFVKSSQLVVNFDMQPSMITLIDRSKEKFTDIKNIQEGITKLILNITQGDSFEILSLMKHDTLDVTNYYIIDHKIDSAAGLTYAFVNHDEAAINLIEPIYDINNNKIAIDSTSNIGVNLYMSLGSKNEIGNKTQLEWHLNFSMLNKQAFISPLDSSFFIEKNITATRNTDAFIFRKSIYSLRNQQDIAIASGSDNLFGYYIGSSYASPYPQNSSNLRKSIIIGLNTLTLTPSHNNGLIEVPSSASYIFNINNLYISKQSIIQGVQNDKYLYSSMWLGMGYWPPQKYGMLRTADFTINEIGEAIFEKKRITISPWEDEKISSAYIYETVKSRDTIKIEQNAHLNFPDCMTYVYNGTLYMKENNDWNESSSYGGIKQVNGVNECRLWITSYWHYPLFTTQVFSHNRTQTNIKPFSLDYYKYLNNYNVNLAMYAYNNLNNIGTIRILSDAHPYAILGQAGQSTADFEYKVPLSSNDKTVFPSFNLLQVSVEGKSVDLIHPDQNGKIRLVLFDQDSSITSTNLSLLLASGDEIELPVSYVGNHEYDAEIPNYIPQGFIDIIAKAKDTKGNKCELTASPGFYFGNIADNLKLDARLRMNSYTLNNVATINMQTGDILDYTLSYVNYGNGTARNVIVNFPTTKYFKPIGSQSKTIDSIRTTDTVKIQFRLVFLGKQQSIDVQAYYSPSVAWTSGGTNYLRNNKILVDFSNTFTAAAKTESRIPEKFELYQNYPNPFNPSTMIEYDIPKISHVSLIVYNILGQKIENLINDIQPAGNYKISWNVNSSKSASSGVYFVCLHADSFYKTIKILLLK
jgi:hypothetical protein